MVDLDSSGDRHFYVRPGWERRQYYPTGFEGIRIRIDCECGVGGYDLFIGIIRSVVELWPTGGYAGI